MLHHVAIAVFGYFWEYLLFGPLVCLWLSWRVLCLPLATIKRLLTFCMVSPGEMRRKKRSVLISGGSTVQALHLARNFYNAGARVVMCEVEGGFELTRFSTAVDSYYIVPSPDDSNAHSYIKALCDIVVSEGINYYIPVSSTSPAIYDALAKPHIELLNCVVFCPNSKEVSVLDDLHQVFDRCRDAGLPFPLYYPVTSLDQVNRLYDSGLLRTQKHHMTSVGCFGVTKPRRIPLPPFQQDFRPPRELSERKPWVVVQEMKGDRLIACTTVKAGAVVSNMVCRRVEGGGFAPVDDAAVTSWLQQWLHSLKLRQLTGHLALDLVVSHSGAVVLMGCRVGVPLSYICHTGVHPRLVWKPCRHFSRQSSGSLVAKESSYWLGDAVAAALRRPSVDSMQALLGTVLNEREALFSLWDPLPYCVFYCIALPSQMLLSRLWAGQVISQESTCLTCK